MASGTYKFEIRLRDADPSKQKAMLEGIKAHFNDTSMNIYETKILVVETDCKPVADLLNLLNVNDLKPKKYARRKVAAPEPEPGG